MNSFILMQTNSRAGLDGNQLKPKMKLELGLRMDEVLALLEVLYFFSIYVKITHFQRGNRENRLQKFIFTLQKSDF